MWVEAVSGLLSGVLLMAMVLISVAFVSLMEQKILSSSQIRLGPNFVGVWGLLQPFADAVKLFMKESVSLSGLNYVFYYSMPCVSLVVMLMLWVVLPLAEGFSGFKFGLLYFICVSGTGVLPVLMMGWASNCKYSVLGSLRGSLK